VLRFEFRANMLLGQISFKGFFLVRSKVTNFAFDLFAVLSCGMESKGKFV
jgi:hypothetical protein